MLAILANAKRALSRPTPHAVGPPDGVREPLLLLSLGPRLGRCFLEDECLLPLSDLDLPERARVGYAPAGESSGSVHGSRQWLSQLRRCRQPAKHLQSTGPGAGTELLLALVPPSAFTVDGR